MNPNAQLKLHSYCLRLNSTTGKELFLLCADPEEAELLYNKLKTRDAPPRDPNKGGWVYADLEKAPAP